VFIGPNGIGPWQNEEMRAAIDRRVTESKGSFRVIPVLLPGATREERSRLPRFLVATTWVEFRQSLNDEDAFHRLISGVRGREPGFGPGGALFEGECPYRGLQFFDVADAGFFFGREALTEWLVNELRPKAAGGRESRFLGILGSSGSGKSSLARAGLLAALKRGDLAGSTDWPFAVFRPGAEPLENAAFALSQAAGSAATPSAIRDLMREFRESDRTLHLFARLALNNAPPDRRLVLLVDQFEEVFTLCRDEKARRALVDNVTHAATVAGGQTIVLLTLRADLYGECSAYPPLAAALSDHQVLVGPMQEEELRRAIERPANLVGCEFEPGLVEDLLDEMEGQPGALPLLQYTLLELWGGREGRRLTHACYQSLGRVEGALERRAEQVYERFSEPERQVCRRVFLRLVQPLESGNYSKRRVNVSDFMPVEGDRPMVERVVAELAGPEARLLTIETSTAPLQVRYASAGAGAEGALHRASPEAKPAQHLDVAHESLIRSWGRLRRWLDEDMEFQLWQKRLRLSLEEWERTSRHPESLLRGALLREAERWLEERRDDLNLEEREFIEAGAAVQLLREEEEREQQRELKLAEQRRFEAEQQKAVIQARAARRFRGLALVLAAVALLAAGAAVYAVKRGRVAASRELAASARNVPDTDAELGVILALHAMGRTPTREAEEALHRAVQLARDARFRGHEAAVNGVAVSPDGKLLATAGADNTARLWDAGTGDELRTILKHEASLQSVAFSPDGKRLVVAAADGAVKLLDAGSGQLLAGVAACTGVAMDAAFSRDGRRIATACWEQQSAAIWDAASGQRIAALAGHTAGVSAVAFSPDSSLLATGSADGAARLWKADGGAVRTLAPNAGAITDVAFNTGGTRIAASTVRGTIHIWDAASGALLISLPAHIDGVSSIAFGSSDEEIASAGLDGTAKVWDTRTREALTLSGHKASLTSLAFLPSSPRRLATGAKDNAARLYELDPDQLKALARKLVAAAPRTLTPEECSQYLHEKQCPALP
jgi:hypothetical protein